MCRTFITACASLFFLSASACRPVVLNQEKSFELEQGVTYELEVDPVAREQKIKVQVTASGGPVNVYVFLKKDSKAAEKVIRTKSITTPVLAHWEKTESATLEATIPADSAAIVLFELASGKHANVTAKITN